MENFTGLRRFFEEFKKLSFWQRLFSWKSIRLLSYEACEDFIQLAEELRRRQTDADSTRHERDLLQQEKTSMHRQLLETKESFLKFELRMQHLDMEIKRIQSEKQELQKKLLVLEQDDSQRRREQEMHTHRFLALQDNLEKEKMAMREKETRQMEERNQQMKETWKRHEDTVQQTIKSICDRNAVEYVESVPFKGKPDNVIRICDEYIVFDAKSPASDDLGNFNTYIRTQAEAAIKYTSCDAVRKDIYLVVPSNTLDVLKNRNFNLGNFNVFVITTDALEPVIASLKKLEEYEFAEQMSPEDRQSICRIVGSYIYLTKRRIQVDQDFNSHALELLSKTQREIPDVMQEDISKQERAMKINPPADRRAKAISQDALEKNHAQQEGQGKVFEIVQEGVELGLVVSGY